MARNWKPATKHKGALRRSVVPKQPKSAARPKAKSNRARRLANLQSGVR
jgi:hypothetical protein